MSDNRTVSGNIEVENEGRHATAFKLMEKIGYQEHNEKKSEQVSRDYWLKLFVQCVDATYRHVPSNLK